MKYSGFNSRHIDPLGTEPSITELQRRRHERAKTKLKCYIAQSICCMIVSVILVLVWITYSSINHYLITDPPAVSGHIGSGATTLVGCYDINKTQSVTIKGETGDYSSDLYVVAKPDLETSSYVLQNHDFYFMERSMKNMPVNYYSMYDPVYIASDGMLQYSVTGAAAVDTSNSVSSGFQFFLYSSQKDFEDFVFSSDITPRNYYMSSDFINISTAVDNSSVSFDVSDHEGFYFVVVHLNNVILNGTIGGRLTSFFLPFDQQSSCSLSDTSDRSCAVVFTNIEDPHSNYLCILSSSTTTQYFSVDIEVKNIDWPFESILILVFASLSFFTGLMKITIVLIILGIVYFIRSRKKAKMQRWTAQQKLIFSSALFRSSMMLPVQNASDEQVPRMGHVL